MEEAIRAPIEVHRHLGPGLMESADEACVCAELAERGVEFERQRALFFTEKGGERRQTTTLLRYSPGAGG